MPRRSLPIPLTRSTCTTTPFLRLCASEINDVSWNASPLSINKRTASEDSATSISSVDLIAAATGYMRAKRRNSCLIILLYQCCNYPFIAGILARQGSIPTHEAHARHASTGRLNSPGYSSSTLDKRKMVEYHNYMLTPCSCIVRNW